MRGARYQCSGEVEVEGGICALDVAPIGGFCLAGSAEGELIMLGADGAELWRKRLGNRITDVRCAEGGEYAVALTEDRNLCIFSATGQELWCDELRREASCIDLRPGSNMIAVGNRYRHLTYITVHGKHVGGVEAPHPIDFVRFAPDGNNCALACEDGHLTLLGYGGKALWTALVHRMIIGLDVACRADLIITPSQRDGIVAVDAEGVGVGVYEIAEPIAAAEIDDDGKLIVALDEGGSLIALDREARLLGRQETGIRADRLALDSEGGFLAVASRRGEIRLYYRADASVARSDFLEVREQRGKMRLRDEDDPVRYLDI